MNLRPALGRDPRPHPPPSPPSPPAPPRSRPSPLRLGDGGRTGATERGLDAEVVEAQRLEMELRLLANRLNGSAALNSAGAAGPIGPGARHSASGGGTQR